jgi:Uma2 family endonuclease
MATIIPEFVIQDEPLELPLDNLPETDGIPLESAWHRAAIALLIESVFCRMQGRTDYYVGGNMFIYYSSQQARTRKYRGPDFFFVNEVDGTHPRRFWVVWNEGGKYPDVIIELLSPTTAREDQTTKKTLYERTFRTPEYFCYDPQTRRLEGWRLQGRRYAAIVANDRGWLWSEELGLWLGTWEGVYLNENTAWLRFYNDQGELVLTLAEQERQRAEQERQRAEALETELTRLKALLAEQQSPPSLPGNASP